MGIQDGGSLFSVKETKFVNNVFNLSTDCSSLTIVQEWQEGKTDLLLYSLLFHCKGGEMTPTCKHSHHLPLSYGHNYFV